MNNAEYGLTLQKMICDKYKLAINEQAYAQFSAGFNAEYRVEFERLIPKLFSKISDKPTRLLTYTREFVDGKASKNATCPHNFILESGKTLSIRTVRTSDRVAPKVVGQAGFPVLNEYFSDIYGDSIETQEDIRRLMYEHIHQVLPIFIEHLFQSDYTVLLNRKEIDDFQIIVADEVANFTFDRTDFSFTRGLDTWKESTTLKYHSKTIAEIQTHKERSFKFRFSISNIPEWFRVVKKNNETLGMSAEGAICDYFHLLKPESFSTRVSGVLQKQLLPVVQEAFCDLPKPIRHSGSTAGERGEQSKCSYDFVLEGEKTLSLKTNTGKMVCPPEVGQPGSKTCAMYFKKLVGTNVVDFNQDVFKNMVLSRIDKMMPIYIEHMFDSDWLLWIYKEKNEYRHIEISRKSIKSFEWDYQRFSFTKKTIEEWNESNTVKYDGMTVGEFQVHKNRNCYKFRFQFKNLLKLLLKDNKID